MAYSYGYGITVDVPAHTSGDIQVGVEYSRWWGDIQTRTCVVQTGHCNAWSPGVYTRVEHAIAPAVRFRKD